MDPAVRYMDLRTETLSIFEKVGAFLADLCDGSGTHQDAAEASSLDSNLGSFYETFSRLQARHGDQTLTVAVLALTKSGKSTLLNALIGANCLPANNVPETARITRITHTQGTAELVDNAAEQPKLVTGEEDIKAYLRYLNSEARTRDHLLSDEKYLDLKIPIAALQASSDVTAAAQTVTIRLLDTPGPNEAGEVALKAQIERLLDSVDAVIYLLDYTKLKTADEAEVLQRLKEINPQLIARLSQRLFFVVNKADMIETSEGLDAEATKQYVADLITSQMQDESFQLKPDQVLLLSAQQALLSRLVLQGKADRDINMRFGRLAFGSRARKFSEREHKQAAEEMLTDSGLAELEERVLAFLYAHSGSLKLLALLDDVVRMLSQIKNVAAASNVALQHDVASLKRETEEMQSKLERSLQSFETVQQEAQSVEGEVVDEVQQRMQHLKERLFCEVTSVLEPSRAHPPGRWQEAWHRAARFLNRRPGHTEAHQLELQNKLYELHAAISSSIEAEVNDFWQDVEAATNERQRSMFQCINRRLESLSREIEETVGQVLDLRLEPITIAMDPPAAQDFHDSLQNLFAQGIRQRSMTRRRHRQQDHTVWEPHFRNGLCRTGQYFVGRPARRNVAEQYQQSVYDVQPHHIKEYFIALVDGTVEASITYVREYVHAYLSDMLEDARGQIQEYGQSFNTTMVAALCTMQQGEAARSAALSATSARLTATNALLHDVATIQRHAEALCPGDHHISDVMSEFSLDEPESSHAVHAVLHPEVEPSSGTEPTAPVLNGVETGTFYPPPVNDVNHPQLWDQALAGPTADSSGSQVPAVERQWPAVGVQKSPLPAMMSELHEAMSASISSAGSSDAVAEGLPLDEHSELELALFLSLEEARAQADRQAATAAVASPLPAASPVASAVAAGRQGRPYGPTTWAGQSATAVAAAASSAATAAAMQAEAAAQRAGDAVNAQLASAHDTVHAVMGQVDAVLRSLPHFNGPMLTRADSAHTQNSDSIQQEEAELAWAAGQMASSGGSGGSIGHVSDDLRQDVFMPSGYDNLPEWWRSANEDSSAPSSGDSPAASVAASIPAVATAAATRMHSFTSDDSSFDFADAVHAVNTNSMPAAPTDQFAALSLLDLESAVPGPSAEASVSHLDMLESGIQYVPEEQSDSPFFAGNDSPFAVGCQTTGSASSGDHAVPISYSHINLSSPSEESSSPVVYPQVHPAPTPAEYASLTPAQEVGHSWIPPSPRTQMHNLALGGDMFHGHASGTASVAEGWEAAPRPGTAASGTSQAAPFISSLQHPQPTADIAAGSVDVLQHEPPLVFLRPTDAPVRRQPAPEQSVPSADADCFYEGPASIHVHQEEAEGHPANNRQAALSGHGELSQEDSSEWELVSSDVDED
ncbi:hypothetical protein WJX77_008617 [Trebouxia sp. C0004]